MSASKILVVEDEGLVGLELTESLAQMGYEVGPAVPSGRQALELAAREQPDLILMDIRLEGALDGIETARRIREQYRIPVIYLTAHSDEATLQRAAVTGSFGYLLKPFEGRSLRAAIEVALYKSRQDRERETESEWNEAIGEHLADGLVFTDPQGVIKYVNRAAADLAGRPPAECLGRPLDEVFPAVDARTREPYSLPVPSVIVEDRTIVSDRLLLIGRGPHPACADFVLKPVKNRARAAVGVICLLKPVTEKLKSEREIRFELENSKRYQLGLLPERGRAVNGVSSQWLFHPSVFGSGDVFNLFPLSEDQIGFYLLDVMGHGFSSAVLATTIYSFLSSDIARLGILRRAGGPAALSEQGEEEGPAAILSPGEVIAELNRRFYLKSDDNPFFTLVYGIIDVASGRGKLARAGHAYPLLFDRSGRVDRLSSRGQAIGAFPEISVEEKEFAFGPGARLALFSDGLLELLEHGEADEGGGAVADEPLIRFLEEHARFGLAEIRARLEDRIASFHPEAMFEDDVAFFALERE